MTNKEAIETIHRIIDDSGLYGNPTFTNDAIKALFMGIDALKREDLYDDDLK